MPFGKKKPTIMVAGESTPAKRKGDGVMGHPPKTKKVTPTAKPARITMLEALVSDLNKKMKGLGHIGIGSNIQWLDPDRLRTGVLSLDVISCGGLPRRSMIQFWGPYSSAKTTTTLLALAAAQRIGHNVMLAAAETFNKQWGRTLGAWIQYSAEEFDKLESELSGKDPTEWKQTREAMEIYNEGAPGLGQFLVAMHPFGDGLLELTYQILRTNQVALGAVDSFAVCKPSKLIEENEVGDNERGSGQQIQMLIQFCNKMLSAFSGRYDEEGNQKDGGVVANETSLIAINQARMDQNAGPQRGNYVKYKPAMGEALNHFWNLSCEFRKGEEIGEEVKIGERTHYARYQQEVRVLGHKSRVGPPHRSGSFTLTLADYKGQKKGTIDVARESRTWGVYYNVIDAQGAWYVLPDGSRHNGKDKVDQVLREDEALRNSIDEEVLVRCRR